MADLMAASAIPTTSHGNGTAVRRPTAGPAPTNSPSGIKGPRMIMQERAAREARQKAEAEQRALDRSRAEQETRLLEDAQRRTPDRRSAGVATGQGRVTEPQHQVSRDQAAQRATQALRASGAAAAATAKLPTESQIPAQVTAHAAQQQQQPQSPTYVTSSGRTRSHQQNPNPGNKAQETSQPPTEPAKPRNSFPHAFERWETLSAHWEGLTSYWIRKLEQNKDDINRDPISQQLARQVTDLSAAGANLFHAVVELQRLRASSERKFQRWFFETRAELERAQEVNAMLEKGLESERRDRADAIRDALEHERGTSKAQKQLAEMRKELAISKEEARRAWEELGRREQEERDRTLSLQSGYPTIVGGVQVVPMTPGGVSRQSTVRENAPYQTEHTQGHNPEYSQAPPAMASLPTAGPSGAYYQSHQPSQSQTSRGPVDVETGFCEGEFLIDAAGNFVLDSRGQKIPVHAAPPSGASVSDQEPDDHDTSAATIKPSVAHDSEIAPASGDKWTGTYSEQDYTGQGYGTPGWETVPRHHHPTRLSDVIEEEDDRSRTSASQR